MEQLLRSTTAYKMLAHEAAEDRLANTYLLLFPDEHNLRGALKVFAPLFFDGSEGTRARIGRDDRSGRARSSARARASARRRDDWTRRKGSTWRAS